MARKKKAEVMVLSEPRILEYFKYNPATDGDQTFNIDLALNENWDKTKAEFERLDGEIKNIDVSWGGIKGKPETFPPSVHKHSYNDLLDKYTDGRGSGNKPPTFYQGKGHYVELINGNEVGLTGHTGLCTMETLSAWTDTSGGITQRIYPNGTSILFTRFSTNTTTWSGWSNDADTLDGKHATDFRPSTWTPTKADVGLGNVPNYPSSGAVNDASNAKLATSGAVKLAYDKAVEAYNLANSSMGLKPSATLKETLVSTEQSIASGYGKCIAEWIPKANGVVKVIANIKSSATGVNNYPTIYMTCSKGDTAPFTSPVNVNSTSWDVPIGGTLTNVGSHTYSIIVSSDTPTSYVSGTAYLEVRAGVPVKFFIGPTSSAGGATTYCNSLKIYYDEVSL